MSSQDNSAYLGTPSLSTHTKKHWQALLNNPDEQPAVELKQ
jgi:hypothetical protein